MVTNVPPGMVEIPGGTVTVDDIEDYETANRRVNPSVLNLRKTISVNSFYMDAREIRNIDWREYLNWLTAVYGKVAPEIVEKARPDIKAWNQGLGENEPFMMNYFTHPSFNEYPVVCISWEQAVEYCAWRTDRANELLLIQQGVLKAPDFNAIAAMTDLASVKKAIFTTKEFFAGPLNNPGTSFNGLYPDYRLPSEDEWEYAAYAKGPGSTTTAVYPWDENKFVNVKNQKKLIAHYNRASVNGGNTDIFSRTVPVTKYGPNDFGLYNMSGNVNEWVFDRYSTKANISKVDSTDILDVFLPDQLKKPDTRVYKGGSWKDPVFWLHPSGRRSLAQQDAASDIGFRCAMSAVPVQIRK
jgi:formylglycine-generating enzyme required for sulfatase activity